MNTLIPFNDFNDFKDTYKKYHKDRQTLFYKQFYHIVNYKKSSKWYKRLFNIKKYDSDNSGYGFTLSPIINVKCLCPMLDEVDIEYRSVDNGQLYRSRVKPEDIYHYNWVV